MRKCLVGSGKLANLCTQLNVETYVEIVEDANFLAEI